MSEEKNNRPVFDEQTLGKLLEAAYVLQEHNRELRSLELSLQLKRDKLDAEEKAAALEGHSESPEAHDPVPTDYSFTLAKIVGTQHQIQLRQLGLQDTMSLVVERSVEIARAAGGAIALLEGKTFRYRAVAGRKTLTQGTTVPIDKALCLPCLKTAQVFRCADVNPEFLLDANECRRRGIQSLIAVPVFHNGEVAGALELYYSTPHAFSDQDVHTCQLMAGLITEALVREEERMAKKSAATERAALLQAIEQLKPNLEALVDKPQASATVSNPATASSTAPSREGASSCRKCGHRMGSDEQFCGQCGLPRHGDYEPPSMQSRVAAMLMHRQDNGGKSSQEKVSQIPEPPKESQSSKGNVERAEAETPVTNSLATTRAVSLEAQVPQLFEPAGAPESTGASDETPADLEAKVEDMEILADINQPAGEIAQKPEEEEIETEQPAHQALTRPDWNSAASAREFLEQLASADTRPALARFWNERRGDIYLAIAVILVGCVIRWGIWSDQSVKATSAPVPAASHRKAPEPELSLFDRMLIQLGLAEAPDPPQENGNPTVHVWIDSRTALYYCPGADLYGKTPNGKFMLQREAQLDQYEPAYRKPCI